MEFFKKLFGISTEEETSNYNKNEHEDNTPQVKVETKSEKPTSKQPNNPNMTSWENFFGVNLKESPNASWKETQGDFANNKKIRNFICDEIDSDYFSYVKAKVIGDSATNFFFKRSYNWDDAFDIYYLIERDMVHGGKYANTDAADKFRGNFDSYYDHFDWEIDGCHITLSRDIDNGDIELSVWTLFYNKEYLDNMEETTVPATPVEEEVEEPSLPQRTFHVHFPDSIETLQFAREYMKAVVSGNTPIHIARADGNTIQILEEDSFEELYSFRNSEIASYLSGRLSAVSFAKFNCDDITDIQADAIVVVAGPSNEEDKKEPDALIHYEMDYLVDPIEIDYRRKTIMDGTMNLNLVGIQYRDNYEELMETLEEGMKVVLKPEPTNEFDPNALAFYYNDEVIGYLPKKDQPFAHIFMAKGQIEATICNIDEQWIDTEVVISKDMIDFDAYESNGVRFTKIESFKGGNRRNEHIELSDFVETIC